MPKLASKDDLYELLLRSRVHLPPTGDMGLAIDRALIPYLREHGRIAKNNFEYATANGFPHHAANWAKHVAFYRDELLGCLQRVEAGDAAEQARVERLEQTRAAKG